MTALHWSSPVSPAAERARALLLSWRFACRSGRSAGGLLHLRIEPLDSAVASLTAWTQVDGSMIVVLPRTPVAVEWTDVATATSEERHLRVRGAAADSLAAAGSTCLTGPNAPGSPIGSTGSNGSAGQAGTAGRGGTGCPASAAGPSTPSGQSGMPDPTELVAVFRGSRLLYLRSSLPVHAGLRGGTYELETWSIPDDR